MREIKNAFLFFISLALLTGVIYPASVTVLAQFIFPDQAGGSLIRSADGLPVGSALIGQPFSAPGYFRPRPSATADFPYNALASGGSNLGPTNNELIAQVKGRVNALKEEGITDPVPADMVTTSASGLDPHISPEAVFVQVPRIARERRMSEERVQSLVQAHLEDRTAGFIGAPRVNVLKLNLALDKL